MVLKHEYSDSELSKIIPHSATSISNARYKLRKGKIKLKGYDPNIDIQYGLLQCKLNI